MIAILSIVIIVGTNNSSIFVYSEVEIPTEYNTFKDEEFGIEFEYPNNWVQLGDFEFGDFTTTIAIFTPLEEIKFKKFDSAKDFGKLDYRISIDLGYSYLIPKINLHMVLDNIISNILSIDEFKFKDFEILESTTKSKLDNRSAYELTYQGKQKGDHLKYHEVGIIVEDNMDLRINFKSIAEDYDKFLPVFEHIKNSFKITNPDW